MRLFQIHSPRNSTHSAGVVTATVEWNPGFAQAWAARYDRGQKMLDQEILRLTEPYVPFDTGMLAHSPLLASHIGAGLLVWNTPYAADQYYNPALTRPYDPRRGGQWFERMKADNLNHLVRFAEGAVRG